MTRKRSAIIRIVFQILFFIWIPESFSVTLFALKTLVHSVAVLQFEHILDPVIVLAGTMVSTILFGRYYCGYICAFGAMQDLSFGVRRLVFKNGKQHIVPAGADRMLSKIKYVILALILILAALEITIPAELSPWACFGSLTSFLKGTFNVHHVLTAGLGILLAIVLITAFYYRAFCRYLCPVGAVYSLVSAASHDRRTRPCKNSGDCCICPYKCGRYRIHYPGMIAAILIFIGTNLYLTNVYYRSAAPQAEEPAAVMSAVSAEEPSAVTSAVSAEGPAAVTSAVSAGEPSAVTSAVSAEQTAADTSAETAEEEIKRGPFTDGIHEGVGTGYNDEICVSVVVENGNIVSVTVTEQKEDEAYFKNVESRLIEQILETQSADVDIISGATYSSEGLIQAVKQATGFDDAAVGNEAEDPKENSKTALDLSHLEDGVYEGTGIGFRGEIKVAVTVRDHKAEEIRILSYYDNEEYLFHVSEAVINEVVNGKPLDVDAVSGATYSSNGLTRAIADALKVDEESFDILEAKPRKMKRKDPHHVTQKFVESDEQYQELVDKYTELMYGPDGRKTK